MKTFGSLFTGFGGADIGAKAAGLQLAWGVELIPAIAEVGNANLGQHIKVANILDCKPTDFDHVDVLHASPPCPNFSVAKANGAETALDTALAAKVAEFVTVLQPEIFTLENVMEYRRSRSWASIEAALHSAGYWLNIEICNSADYAVPQTRRRMIVRAIRGGFVPYLPQPVPWVGWYEAIEDILHTLPESQFAPWQLARLPKELRHTFIADCKNTRFDGATMRNVDEPMFTVMTDDRPSHSPRAFLVNGDNATRDCSVRTITDPTFTVTDGRKHPLKAFIVGKQYDAPNSKADRCVQTRMANEPALTVVTRTGDEKAFDGGKVVAMTPRALARFQSFPDSYILPDSKTLAAKGIGNAVPSLMYQKIMEGLINA